MCKTSRNILCICAFPIDNRLTTKIKVIPNPDKRHKPSITVNPQVVEQIKLINENPGVSDVLRELCTHTRSSYDTFNSPIVCELNNLKKEQEFTSKEVELLRRKVSVLVEILMLNRHRSQKTRKKSMMNKKILIKN